MSASCPLGIWRDAFFCRLPPPTPFSSPLVECTPYTPSQDLAPKDDDYPRFPKMSLEYDELTRPPPHLSFKHCSPCPKRSFFIFSSLVGLANPPLFNPRLLLRPNEKRVSLSRKEFSLRAPYLTESVFDDYSLGSSLFFSATFS